MTLCPSDHEHACAFCRPRPRSSPKQLAHRSREPQTPPWFSAATARSVVTFEEYLGLRDVVAPSSWPALLLVPARHRLDGLRSAASTFTTRTGSERNTATRNGVRARWGFAYSSARLLEWADERSSGFFQASEGRELRLDVLRSGGAGVLIEALLEIAAAGRPAVLAAGRGDARRRSHRRRRLLAGGGAGRHGDRPLCSDVRAAAWGSSVIPRPYERRALGSPRARAGRRPARGTRLPTARSARLRRGSSTQRRDRAGARRRRS